MPGHTTVYGGVAWSPSAGRCNSDSGTSSLFPTMSIHSCSCMLAPWYHYHRYSNYFSINRSVVTCRLKCNIETNKYSLRFLFSYRWIVWFFTIQRQLKQNEEYKTEETKKCKNEISKQWKNIKRQELILQIDCLEQRKNTETCTEKEREREQVGVSVLFSIFTLLCGFIFRRNSNFFLYYFVM